MTVRCLPGEGVSVLGKYNYDTLTFTTYRVISQGDVCILWLLLTILVSSCYLGHMCLNRSPS